MPLPYFSFTGSKASMFGDLQFYGKTGIQVRPCPCIRKLPSPPPPTHLLPTPDLFRFSLTLYKFYTRPKTITSLWRDDDVVASLGSGHIIVSPTVQSFDSPHPLPAVLAMPQLGQDNKK